MIDRNRALTSEDLIRRYDLESLKSNRKAIQMNKSTLDKTENILNNFILSVLKGISNTEDQVDGKVTTWFYNYAPTLNNIPASNWSTDATKNAHLGDLFYNQNNGYVYMFDIINETYTWVRQTDDTTIQAMAIANSNPDTGDGYRNIFVIEPTTPYEVGDIWFKEDGNIYRCVVARASGNFNEAEWVLSSEYSNDDYVNQTRAILDDFKETITTNYICKVLVKTTRDSIELSVESITGGYNGTMQTLSAAIGVTAGKISQVVSAIGSNGKVTAGSVILAINADGSVYAIDADKININGVVSANNNFKILSDGSMEAKNGSFEGTINANSGYIGNWAIENGALYADTTIGSDTYRVYLQPYNTNNYGDDTWIYSIQKNGVGLFSVLGNGKLTTTDLVVNGYLHGYLNLNSSKSSYISSSGCVIDGQIVATDFINSSLEEKKKNIEPFSNALDIINTTDIYKYHLKTEDDARKKHIGIVIGKDYNYSSEITGIDKDNNEVGVDTYSMVSVCFAAIKELTEKVSYLEKKLKERDEADECSKS